MKVGRAQNPRPQFELRVTDKGVLGAITFNLNIKNNRTKNKAYTFVFHTSIYYGLLLTLWAKA